MSDATLAKVSKAAAAKAATPQLTLADYIERQKGELERALPQHVNADHFIRVALNAAKDPRSKLHECSTVSVLSGLMQSAVLGLEIGDVRGQAYLIPRAKQAVFQVGYRGYIDLAWRAGITIDTQVVRDGDRFDFELGTTPRLVHRPALDDDERDATAFYAVAFFGDGRPPIFDVKSNAQMIRHRAKFAARKADDAPWWTDFEAMGRKTMIRLLLGRLPMSVELRNAYEADTVPTVLAPIAEPPRHADGLAALEAEAVSEQAADAPSEGQTDQHA